MFYNQISSALRGSVSPEIQPTPQPTPDIFTQPPTRTLRLVPAPVQAGAAPFPAPIRPHPEPRPRVVTQIVSASAARVAAFLAEAAVLVFVLGILDRFLLKEHIELAWVGGSFAISLVLLAASIGTDVAARRWHGARAIAAVGQTAH